MEQVKQTFDTNTFSALRMAKAVVPSMAERKSGLIVNIGSIVADMWVTLNVVTTHYRSLCSPTPWNGLYSASKAALHTFTEVLQMECRPFNIDVMLVAPGAIKSNISNNQASIFKLPPDSLYGGYLHNMLDRLHSSQGKNTMPTDAFAKLIVKGCLQRKPATYITAGGNTTLFALLKWLPRAWVLLWMWRRFSKPHWTMF